MRLARGPREQLTVGGPRIPPDVLERASRIYAETGNLRETSRQTGVALATLHEAFKRLRIERNRTVHAEACERGLRKARKRLSRLGELAENYVAKLAGNAESPSIEPRDLAAVLNATAKLADSLGGIADRVDRKKQSKLTRDKTRAEIELLRKKINGEHVDRVSLEGVSDAELDARIADALRSKEADEGAEG